MDFVKINKIVSVIQDNNSKNPKIFSFKKKSDFWSSDFIKNAKNIQIVSSSNNKKVISNFINRGFIVDVDDDWGFDWDIKIFAKK